MQDEFNKTMEELFHSLKDTGLQREAFHEDISWKEYVQITSELTDDDVTLKRILHQKTSEDRINQITLHELLNKDFKGAKNTINQMTILKRIQLLEDVQEYRTFLYDNISKHGQSNVPKEEQLTIKAYRAIMGRIKHLEIIMGWLFGIE